jgi:hypothetical protein
MSARTRSVHLYANTIPPESQRALLRTLHSQARRIYLERRIVMYIIMYGEVHVGVERREQDVRWKTTAGTGSRSWVDHILDVGIMRRIIHV